MMANIIVGLLFAVIIGNGVYSFFKPNNCTNCSGCCSSCSEKYRSGSENQN